MRSGEFSLARQARSRLYEGGGNNDKWSAPEAENGRGQPRRPHAFGTVVPAALYAARRPPGRQAAESCLSSSILRTGLSAMAFVRAMRDVCYRGTGAAAHVRQRGPSMSRMAASAATGGFVLAAIPPSISYALRMRAFSAASALALGTISSTRHYGAQ